MSRNNQIALLIALLGIGAWLWFTRSGRMVAQAAGETVSAGASMVAKLIRGERNNNPGNIRISASAWRGKIPLDRNTDGAFEQFDTVENGIRALGKLLIGYSTRYGLNTVRKIITRFAPPSENVTDSYVNAVARDAGIGPDVKIAVADPVMLNKLVTAIIKHENGRVIYAPAIIQEGVNRALV